MLVLEIKLCLTNIDVLMLYCFCFDSNLELKLFLLLQGLGTDEGAIIEILCTRNNRQIQNIVATYKMSECVGNGCSLFCGLNSVLYLI